MGIMKRGLMPHCRVTHRQRLLRKSVDFVDTCQLRLKFPHSSGRKSCHPGLVLVYISSRFA
jgi:hypothetical protein